METGQCTKKDVLRKELRGPTLSVQRINEIPDHKRCRVVKNVT